MSEHELETQVKWLWEHHHEDFSDINSDEVIDFFLVEMSIYFNYFKRQS